MEILSFGNIYQFFYSSIGGGLSWIVPRPTQTDTHFMFIELQCVNLE